MMNKEIKRIDPISLGKIYGLSLAFVGLILGGFFSLISMVAGAAFSDSEFGMFSGMIGTAAVITLPIFYGIMGLISGIIGAAIYNLVAKMTGGIKIELVDDNTVYTEEEL